MGDSRMTDVESEDPTRSSEASSGSSGSDLAFDMTLSISIEGRLRREETFSRPTSSASATASTLNVLPAPSLTPSENDPTLDGRSVAFPSVESRLTISSELLRPIPLLQPVPRLAFAPSESFDDPLTDLTDDRFSPSPTLSSVNPSHQLPFKLRSTSRRVVGSTERYDEAEQMREVRTRRRSGRL